MTIIDLSKENTVLNTFIAEIRDAQIQKEPMRFRRNLERIGEIFAYEISRKLRYMETEVQTPLGIATINTYNNRLVLGTLLRAGLPLHNGILNFFDGAQNCFIAAYRKTGKDNKFTINLEYSTCPSLEGKTLILADTLAATGASLVLAYNKMMENGEPEHTHIVCPIVSKDGLDYLSSQLPHKRVTLWTAGIDDELTNKSYIIPGLGDAGNLAYGERE